MSISSEYKNYSIHKYYTQVGFEPASLRYCRTPIPFGHCVTCLIRDNYIDKANNIVAMCEIKIVNLICSSNGIVILMRISQLSKSLIVVYDKWRCCSGHLSTNIYQIYQNRK